jgi:hypothetical protein
MAIFNALIKYGYDNFKIYRRERIYSLASPCILEKFLSTISNEKLTLAENK